MPTIKAHYYQQFCSGDPTPPVAASMGGWHTAPIELSVDHTALVVMHAWDCRDVRSRYPGWYRCAESIDRMNQIIRDVLAPLLQEARTTGLPVFHVAYPGDYYQHLPGFKRAARLSSAPEPVEQIPSEPSLDALRAFHRDRVFVGAENVADVQCAFDRLDFAPPIYPLDDETVVDSSQQLFSVCKHDGINHLVYTGFTVNGCVLMMPGGMEDMRRHGLLCSLVREATTAIENRETIRTEAAKELGLWMVSLVYGFVFEQRDIVDWMRQAASCRAFGEVVSAKDAEYV